MIFSDLAIGQFNDLLRPINGLSDLNRVSNERKTSHLLYEILIVDVGLKLTASTTIISLQAHQTQASSTEKISIIKTHFPLN